MNRKSFILIGCCLVLGIGIAGGLSIFYNVNVKDSKLNGFNRLLKSNAVTQLREFDLGDNSFYLAGTSDESIYLGNYVGTTLIMKTNYDFTDTTHLTFTPTKDLNLVWKSMKAWVNPPDVYLAAGTSAEMLNAKLPSTQVNPLEGLDNTYFTSSVPLSNASFILKAFDRRQQQYGLIKKISGAPYDSYSPGILGNQGDGYFSVDGKLLYQPKTGRLIYLYKYRNQFITLDSSLNVIHHGSTIDTVSTARVRVAEPDDGKGFTIPAPPPTVNANGCLSSKWLFVNSALKGDNENSEKFEQFSVIDVYTLENGVYQLSFYLQNPNDMKLSGLMVHDDILIAVFGRIIRTYRLNLNSHKTG